MSPFWHASPRPSTDNYDSLIRQVTGRPSLHWKQQNEITRFIRDRSKEFTLHIHGQWDVIESIVLDRKSYDAIKADVKMQGLQ